MKKVFCLLDDSLADPLFEFFDGGDFVLSSYKGIEDEKTEMRVYVPEDGRAEEAADALRRALALAGAGTVPTSVEDVPDEDWKFSYRKHFKPERIGARLATVPLWERGTEAAESVAAGREAVYIEPGMAFGTGRHETTRACLEFIDAFARPGASFLDMGCGSGILSIAAAKLGFAPVGGFDIDPAAVDAARENAAVNGVAAEYRVFALGGGKVDLDSSIEAAKGLYPDLALQNAPAAAEPPFPPADFVVANILGPLLIAFAGEIAAYAKDALVLSGMLAEEADATVAPFLSLGFREDARKRAGEWSTSLLRRERFLV